MFKIIFLLSCFVCALDFFKIVNIDEDFDLKVGEELSLFTNSGVSFYKFNGDFLKKIDVFSKCHLFNDYFYFSDDDGNFCCVDFNSETLFKIPVNVYFKNDMAFSDGYVFALSTDGEFFCFDAYSGELMYFSIDLVKKHSKNIEAKIIIKDYIYICFHEKIYCLNKFSGKVVWQKKFDGIMNFAMLDDEIKVYTINGDFSLSLDGKKCVQIEEEVCEIDERDYLFRMQKKEISKENYRYFDDKIFAFYKNLLVVINKNDKEYINLDFEIKELWYSEGKLVVFDGKVIRTARI